MTLKALLTKCDSQIEMLENKCKEIEYDNDLLRSDLVRSGNSAERIAIMQRINENNNDARKVGETLIQHRHIREYLEKEGDI